MAWFKDKSKVPEKFQNLTDEQLIEKLTAGETAVTKVTELEGKQATSDSELTRLRDSVKLLEKKLETPSKPPDKKDPPTEPTSFLEDEDRAFNERFNANIAPLVNVVLTSSELAAKMSWRNDVIGRRQGHVLAKLESQVEELMQKEAPARRADPKAWQAMFTYVKGLNFDDTTSKLRKGEDIFAEPVGGNNGRSRDNEPPEEVTLNDEDKALCKKFRLSEAEFLKQKKEQQVVA